MIKNEIYLAYKELLEKKKIAEDKAQADAVLKLSQLAEKIEAQERRGKSLITRFFGNRKGTGQFLSGLYIYGDVGRGKSMLMDLFVKNIKTGFSVRRVHFHSFMKEVHERIKHWRESDQEGKRSNIIKSVVSEIAEGAQILCFDEMQVQDIADAMIIGRVFEGLFEQNVVIIVTSNRHPDELYKNGLQRERFLPFIELFKSKMDVFQLKSPTDYRMRGIKSLKKLYFTPLGADADDFAENAFTDLTGAITGGSTELLVKGRKISVPKFAASVAVFNFKDLCDKPLGSEDYLEVAKEFKTIILCNVPKLSKDDYNQAIRFIHLVDVLYENKVKLIITSEVLPQQIYIEGERSFEFERTISRLNEMQSEDYLYLTPSL